MLITYLSSAQLKKLLPLIREIKSLQVQLSKIKAEQAQLDGTSMPVSPIKRRYRK